MKCLHVLAGLLLLSTTALAQSTSPLGDLQNWSIFSRQRGTPVSTTAAVASLPATLPAPLLVGVISQNGRMEGLLEVTTPRGVSLLHVLEGDPIAWNNTRVSRITMAGMVLSNAQGTSQVVAPGTDLAGKMAELARPATAPASAPLPRTRRAFVTGPGRGGS